MGAAATPKVLVAGVDEVGRGPIFGAVVAAAVILDPSRPITGLRDSKRLSARQRADLVHQIQDQAVCWAVAEASVEEVDRLNILHASLLAMTRALSELNPSPGHALIDGNQLPKDLPCPATPVIKGDQLEPAIMAASILAKETRDAQMIEFATRFPGYGLEQHMGYATAQHLEALRRLGPTPFHRRSFKPVQQAQLDF